jgi:hypothetical protein
MIEQMINFMLKLPKWYGISIVFAYSVLIAEFFSTLNHLLPIINGMDNNIVVIFLRIGYVLTILSGIIVWIITTFLFHLTALLFNGQSQFNRFLYISSYPYIIPAIVILSGIFLLDGIQIDNTEHAVEELMANSSYKLAMNLINYSFIPYYVIVGIFIHYIYNIKLLYALLSVVLPIFAIWVITQLFSLI